MKFLGIRFDKHTLGNALKNVAPALAFTPVGALGAGVAAFAGGKLRGESTGRALKSGASNALIGGAGKVGKGIFDAARMTGDLSGVLSSAPGVLKDEAMDRFRPVGKFLLDHKRDIVDYGKMGEGVYDRVQENRAVGDAEKRYRSLQPLRDQAMKDLMQPTAPVDTAALFADPTAPQRYRRVNVGGY